MHVFFLSSFFFWNVLIVVLQIKRIILNCEWSNVPWHLKARQPSTSSSSYIFIIIILDNNKIELAFHLIWNDFVAACHILKYLVIPFLCSAINTFEKKCDVLVYHRLHAIDKVDNTTQTQTAHWRNTERSKFVILCSSIDFLFYFGIYICIKLPRRMLVTMIFAAFYLILCVPHMQFSMQFSMHSQSFRLHVFLGLFVYIFFFHFTNEFDLASRLTKSIPCLVAFQIKKSIRITLIFVVGCFVLILFSFRIWKGREREKKHNLKNSSNNSIVMQNAHAHL